jgi:ATP-binding cassette subfamily C protein LapB
MRTPEQADGSADALLVCLALVAKQLGHPLHVHAMRQGFALDDAGRIPLEAYPDLAHQHGLLAGWSRKKLADIPSYVMPVLVSLVDGRACVLRAIEGNSAVVWWAESGTQDDRVSLEQLQGLARDEVLVVRLPATRNDQTLAPMQGAAFSWFWGTLWRFRHFYVE